MRRSRDDHVFGLPEGVSPEGGGALVAAGEAAAVLEGTSTQII